MEFRPIFPQRWCKGQAQCIQCGHEWIAAWPLAADPLECPECGSDDTYRERKVDRGAVPPARHSGTV